MARLVVLAMSTTVPVTCPTVWAAPPTQQFQGLPPWMAPPQLPPIAHERPDAEWPVPDYFAQALQIAGLTPGERAAALDIRRKPEELPPYIVLPVQVQAFGFSPAFRALAGAYLDREIENAGIEATRQTDAAHAYGPFVRRFTDEQVDALVREHASRKVLGLYIGHDGVDQMFVTVVMQSAAKRSMAHKAIEMSQEPTQALKHLVQALPALLKEVGMPVRQTSARLDRVAACHHSTWDFVPPSRDASPGVRACHAIALGALLPVFDGMRGRSDEAESMSPAKLAWLAQASVLATDDVLPAATAQAIRQLSLHDLGFAHREDPPTLSTSPQLDDPVMSKLVQLKSIRAATERTPARSGREARERMLNTITQDLPPFARAVFKANASFEEAFTQVDLCELERELPGAMLRAACRDDDSPPPPPKRWAQLGETLLYQEWRLAAHFKAVQYAGHTLGSRARTVEALSQWPADVAAHPYLQRLRQTVNVQASSSFEEQLETARKQAREVLQSSVDLQRADRWLSGHSLTGHMSTGNLNIANDAQVREASDKEMRLVSVLRFDRYTRDRYLAERRRGDPPFFLAPATWLHVMSGGLPGLVVLQAPPPGASAPPASVPKTYKPSLFLRHSERSEKLPEAQLSALLAEDPTSLHRRVELAFSRLRDGGSVDDAMRLIDAHPPERRLDRRIEQSHAWAEPGHWFYFAGELDGAQRYYRKVAEIGTGSESDMMARARLHLLAGKRRDALSATNARVQRYDSDFARRDEVGLLFMLGEPGPAWQVFLSRAASSELFQFWIGAYTGHRMEGADLPRIDEWLAAKTLQSTQINYVDVRHLYLHLHAVTDRVPTDADIERLKRGREGKNYFDARWAASARLVRSALEGSGYLQAHQQASAALTSMSDTPSSSFMQPLYAWVAWQATEGKDEALDEVRRATTRWNFDEMLSKSMVLALDGDVNESLRFFRAARYQIAAESERLLPAPYSYALAGFLMHRKTGQDAYRQETLQFVRAQQKVFPFYGWLYAMEALLDNDGVRRKAAACRAQVLDPNSYFLGQAQVRGVDKAACRAAVASLLQ
jgi:hypothetical protein